MNAIGAKPLPRRISVGSRRHGNPVVVDLKRRAVALPIRAGAMDEQRKQAAVSLESLNGVNGNVEISAGLGPNGSCFDLESGNGRAGRGKHERQLSTVGNSTNIKWHKCAVDKADRQKLLDQKGCVIWITGLSGSGKSTVACALSQSLYQRGKLSYILDGDNVRHGLNRDLSFKAEDRAENIRRVGEVAKLFADAGVICIACLISPYQRDRDACRALLPEGGFIELALEPGVINHTTAAHGPENAVVQQVFMDVPLQVCEARDPKGLYRLARAGKIKGFTGIDDPYEPPVDCEIALQCSTGDCSSLCEMAEKVISFLEENGYLQA